MKCVIQVADHIYRCVDSEQVFTTIVGLAKILNVDCPSAEAILFSYSENILESGIAVGEIKSSESVANDFLAKLILGEPEVASSTTQDLEEVLGITNTMKANSQQILSCMISSDLTAKIVLDVGTVSNAAKIFAQDLFLTKSPKMKEKLLCEIVGKDIPIYQPLTNTLIDM